jgi:beta-glucosidase
MQKELAMQKQKFIPLLMIFVLFGMAACADQPPAAPTEPQPTASEPTETPQPEPTAEPGASPTTASELVESEDLLVPQGEAKEIYYAAYPVTITLDGETSDWAGVPRVLLADGPEAETTMQFAVVADDNKIYMLADVKDSQIISGEHGTNFWNEDSVEFYFNATDDLTRTKYVQGVSQINIPPLNIGSAPDEAVFGGMLFDLEGMEAKVVETDMGYLVEASVPLESNVWSIEPGHGKVLGFQSHLNGASSLNRDLKLIWSAKDTGDVSYQNPSVFGQLIFFEIGQTEVVAQVPPTATPPPTRVPVEEGAPYLQPDLPIAERVADLLPRMSLAEKIGQMTLIEKNSLQDPQDVAKYYLGGLLSGGGGYPDGNNSPEGWAEMVDAFQDTALETHLGIPLLYGVDAVHGHNNVVGTVIFPHNIGLGAANNPQLMAEIGRITAAEMIATGIYWNYAPAVSVPQDIRWGRTYEGYSENTDLVVSLAVPYLRGMQGEDLKAPDTVMGTIKHYVGDGGTAYGTSTTEDYLLDQGDTQVDEATLRTVHLPPYEAAIDAGARSIMISFSSWNGQKMHGNENLINDVLKGELGFDGLVVSDWAGIDQVAPNYYTAVVTAINAGIDMNMVPYDYARFMDTMLEAVENGDISIERIDEAVAQILTAKMELGLFERPYSNPEFLELTGSDEHRAVAREAVAQSVVLLKNEGPMPLPLAPDLPSLYVAGSAADDIGIQSGGWTIEWQGGEGAITEGTTILDGIKAAVAPGTTVNYHPRANFEELPVGETIVCIAAVGEKPYAEGHGDVAEPVLPALDQKVLVQMRENCDQLTVVLVSGRPLIISDAIDTWDAVVAAWLPGTEGEGVADVLFGARPFSGKTPYTWPRSVKQLPFDFETLDPSEPLFPFGFGLSTE